MSSHSPVVSDMCVLTQQSGCSRFRRSLAAIMSGVQTCAFRGVMA